jgi:hypothetical protein
VSAAVWTDPVSSVEQPGSGFAGKGTNHGQNFQSQQRHTDKNMDPIVVLLWSDSLLGGRHGVGRILRAFCSGYVGLMPLRIWTDRHRTVGQVCTIDQGCGAGRAQRGI